MFNAALYKMGMRSSLRTLLIFALILVLYFTIIVTMFDPALGSALDEFAKVMPELMDMFGMNPSSATLLGFMSAYLYGFIMLVFPMVFSILCANKLIARYVDRGSMTYLLAAPVSRRAVAFTQMKVIASGIFALIAFATVLGITACRIYFPGELETGKFILLNIGALCLHLFIGGICFLCSCIFNDTKYSVGFGAGIPALAYIIQMMANVGDKFANAKYATFFTLFNADSIAAGQTSALWQMAALFTGAIVLFFTAIEVFCRKDLHI